jgi:hypothetical protein
MLDFGMLFAWLRVVYTNDDVTSSTAPAENAQNGAVAFATTHWSVVRRRKVNRQQHTKRLKRFAARIGDLFTAF